MVYENCRIYGPYQRIRDLRQHVIAIFPDGKRKTVSYPKYLMELKLGRYLTEDETVDHLDQNTFNNAYSNLEIKGRVDHIKEDVRRILPMDFICPLCATPFTLEGNRLHDAIQRSNNFIAGPFCSRSCTGSYGAGVRAGNKELKPLELKPKYYNLKGLI